MNENASASPPEHQARPTSHASRSVLIGAATWFLALLACIHYGNHRLTAILMPLWKPIGALAGPGFNIGTTEKPIYEATPVHIMAWLAGIGLSVFVYIALAYVCSQLWQVLSQLRSRG